MQNVIHKKTASQKHKSKCSEYKRYLKEGVRCMFNYKKYNWIDFVERGMYYGDIFTKQIWEIIMAETDNQYEGTISPYEEGDILIWSISIDFIRSSYFAVIEGYDCEAVTVDSHTKDRYYLSEYLMKPALELLNRKAVENKVPSCPFYDTKKGILNFSKEAIALEVIRSEVDKRINIIKPLVFSYYGGDCTKILYLAEGIDRIKVYQQYIEIVKDLTEDLIKELGKNINKVFINNNSKFLTNNEESYSLLEELIGYNYTLIEEFEEEYANWETYSEVINFLSMINTILEQIFVGFYDNQDLRENLENLIKQYTDEGDLFKYSKYDHYNYLVEKLCGFPHDDHCDVPFDERSIESMIPFMHELSDAMYTRDALESWINSWTYDEGDDSDSSSYDLYTLAYFIPENKGDKNYKEKLFLTSYSIPEKGITSGEWIYYVSCGSLYKKPVDDSDDGRSVKLCRDEIRSFFIYEEWIYYVSVSAGKKIFKMKTDGSEITKLNEDASRIISIVDDWIYYCNISDGKKLYKMNINGDQIIKLNEDISRVVNIIGDSYVGECILNNWIYYCNMSDNGHLYRISTNGRKKKKIIDKCLKYISIYDDWIYFPERTTGKPSYVRVYAVRTNGADWHLAYPDNVSNTSGESSNFG